VGYWKKLKVGGPYYKMMVSDLVTQEGQFIRINITEKGPSGIHSKPVRLNPEVYNA